MAWQSGGQSTQATIVDLLRRRPMTVSELAAELGVSASAVRIHLARLQRDGVVARTATQRGPSRPAAVYGLLPEAELRFSRLYVPVLTGLLHVLSRRLPPAEFDALLREVGRGVMAGRPVPRGDARERTEAASALFNELGAHTTVERHDGSVVIRSYGCPLSAVTREHPEACSAVESLLAEFTGLPVALCCDREERLRCCFEVSLTPGVTGSSGTRPGPASAHP